MTTNELSSTTPASHTDHSYTTVSAHNTSEGRVIYQRCACGLWRIHRNSRTGIPVLEAIVDGHKRATVAVLDHPATAAVRLSVAGIDATNDASQAVSSGFGVDDPKPDFEDTVFYFHRH